MWATNPNDWPLEAEHLAIIARETPHSAPFAWSLEQQGEGPRIRIIHYDAGGVLSEITEMPPELLAPPPGTSLERYASFVRAVARAFPTERNDAFMPRVLMSPELADEDALHRALVDYAFRAQVVHPIWADQVARDAGLPPPDPHTVAIVGAFADAWWDGTDPAIEQMRTAASEHDRVAGRYLLGLAEMLAEWRVNLGYAARTDNMNEDLDERLIAYALPLLDLAADESTRARVERVHELRRRMH